MFLTLKCPACHELVEVSVIKAADGSPIACGKCGAKVDPITAPLSLTAMRDGASKRKRADA